MLIDMFDVFQHSTCASDWVCPVSAEVTVDCEDGEVDGIHMELFNKSLAQSFNMFAIIKNYIRLSTNYQNVTTLSLQTQLQSFSDEMKSLSIRSVCSMKNLRLLNLNDNSLQDEHLTNHIGGLQRLRTLNLMRNRLTSLPPALKFCRLLEEIDIQMNRFVCLPFLLTQIPNLTNVRRHSNPFAVSYRLLRTHPSTRISRLEEAKRPTDEERPVLSLQELSSLSLLASGIIFQSERSSVPELLRENVCSRSELQQCQRCQKWIIYDAPFKVIIFPELFVGMAMQPMCASVCSVQCAELVIDDWDSPYSGRTPAGQGCSIQQPQKKKTRSRPCVIS